MINKNQGAIKMLKQVTKNKQLKWKESRYSLPMRKRSLIRFSWDGDVFVMPIYDMQRICKFKPDNYLSEYIKKFGYSAQID